MHAGEMAEQVRTAPGCSSSGGHRSPVVVLESTGNVTDRVRYSAGGEVRERTGSSPLAFGYGGYLTQAGTRSFDAQLGMGSHRYVLGYGNPIRYVDPDGRIGIFIDGTWNDRDNREQIRDDARTNVVRLEKIYEGRRFYQKGIGTDGYTKHICGAIGCGLASRVDAAYNEVVRV